MFGRPSNKDIKQVEPEDWEAWVNDNDAVVVDVRRQMEWALARVPGSKCIPMLNLYSELEDLDKDQAILVVCRNGGRSMKAAKLLQRNGFTVANLRGGVRKLGYAP